MAIFISFVIVAFVLLFYFAITAELLLKWRSMLERCEMEVFAAIRECSSLVDEERRALFEAICCCKDAQVAVAELERLYLDGYEESLQKASIDEKISAYMSCRSLYERRIKGFFIRPISKMLKVEKAGFVGEER
ncbi:MAG: hypothetical protein II339_04850 [Spirochaetales bacterium]|nr:hypothetical protein [Spirochaetales bacterium]